MGKDRKTERNFRKTALGFERCFFFAGCKEIGAGRGDGFLSVTELELESTCPNGGGGGGGGGGAGRAFSVVGIVD